MRNRNSFLATTFAAAAAALALIAAEGQEAPQDPKKQEELSADHSLATVVDREGVATVRPATSERALCAEIHARLFTGDWLSTGARGANALSIKMKSGATLILGPGAQVELVDADHVQVNRGEVEAGAGGKGVLTVTGPGGASFLINRDGQGAQAASARRVVRAHDGKLETLDADPKWLSGYKSGQSTEALGSLLATVDGREVPLTLGYHTVTIDVRDQIARTVVEESFVNHTNHVLEGVFYFPLPADASISSFGMWIGDELVEGDIVEKEKARAIYEQILREKRDPGLLEWSGGNVFKARVYPISGEKRVKIAYTQVLPKTGDTWSYHYALQSELLRLHPLAKLAINVKVSSAEPLAAIACPSHPCRIRMTEHAASAEFEAQEYTPDHDFELRVATKAPPEGITFVGDRRGEDGYFLARFRAPAADAAALANAEKQPLDVVILADTSGSMAGPARATQIEFVEALLASLSEKDTIQLATCDVETRLAFLQPMPNDETNRAAARRFLEERDALGWSDLATGFKTVLAAAKPSTQVVYVGDGIPTLGDADPSAFAAGVAKFRAGRGTVHAVVPGNTSEPIVLRALSHLGGGTIRSIGGGTDPMQTATALLTEIATPAVHELKLTIDGLAAAAVYPEELPNLPAGREQVIVGRFDPHGGLRGALKVTGVCGDQKITSEARVSLDDGSAGESFIPRLWARNHLDHLLAQGSSAKNKARIVALSEEFQIATPYTSFLVLESDADRERFAVQKRLRMRDGEEFFAKGRTDAAFELARQQMQKAVAWHRDLRLDTLKSLVAMDRGLVELLRPGSRFGEVDSLAGAVSLDFEGYGYGANERRPAGGTGGPATGGRGALRGMAKSKDRFQEREHGALRRESLTEGKPEADGDKGGFDGGDEESSDLDDSNALEPPGEAEPEDLSLQESAKDFADGATAGKKVMARRSNAPAASPAAPSVGRLKQLGYARGDDDSRMGLLDVKARQQIGNYIYDGGRGPRDTLEALFPQIPEPPLPPQPSPANLPWSDEIVALLRTLDRRAVVASHLFFVSSGGTAIDRRNRPRALPTALWLLGKDSWLTRSAHERGDGWLVDWFAKGERGEWRNDWLLGRARPAKPGDESAVALPIAWTSLRDFENWRSYAATAQDAGDGKTAITFTHPTQHSTRFVLTIDRAKSVVVEARWLGDEPTGTTRFSEFMQVADAWWPTQVEDVDETGRVTSTTRYVVESLAADAFAKRVEAELAPRAQLIELGPPPADLDMAKQHSKDGKATLEDRLMLLADAARRGEADEAKRLYGEFAAPLAGRFGLVRIEMQLELITRRHEELRQALLAQAGLLVKNPNDRELSLAEDLLNLTAPLNSGEEVLAVLRALEPVYRRRADRRDHLLNFEQRVIGHTAAMQRPDEAAALQEKAAKDWPDVVGVQTTWADVLAGRGELEKALAYLDRVQKANGPWEPGEVEAIESDRQNLLWNGYRLDDLVARIEGRLRDEPELVNSTGLDMYLSALVMLDREAQWSTVARRWLLEGDADKPSRGARNRVDVAIRHLLGQGYGFYWWNRRFEPEEAAVLADAARKFLGREHSFPWAQQLLAHQFLRATPAARAVLAELHAKVEKGVESLPTAELQRSIQLLHAADYGEEPAVERWLAIHKRVLARWKTLTDATEQAQLQSVIDATGNAELQLELWRTRLARAKEPGEKKASASMVLQLRLNGEWSAEAQAECLAVLSDATAPTPVEGSGDANRRFDLRVAILAWYDFVNWAVDRRVEHELAATPDVNTLPRRRIQALRDELKKSARLAARELLAARAQSAVANDPADWLALDRVWLDVLTRHEVEAARVASLALLDRELAATKGLPATKVELTDAILASRCATTLVLLLTRDVKDAPDALAAHDAELAKRFADAIAGDSKLIDGRDFEWARLVALDQGDELATKLAEWFGDGKDMTRLRYGRDLAHIRAERNQLDGAVGLLEQINTVDPLPHEDWMTVADWYTALGRKEDAARARIAAWSALDENGLGQLVNQARTQARTKGEGSGTSVPDELPDQFVALMKKAQWPGNWIWQLQNVYATTKDFRLLQCLPDAVIGHSAQGIYPFLQALGGFQKLVDEEATVDRVVAEVDAALPRAKTSTDRRALALIRFVVQYKAAAQQNGGGPHADAALVALKAAFERDWSDGEERQYAALLQSLGPFVGGALRAEQFRQMGELSGRVASGGADRLAIVDAFAQLRWSAGEQDVALRLLGGEIAAQRAANGGRLPDRANESLLRLVGFEEQAGEFVAAETIWNTELAVAANVARSQWLELRLHATYASALRLHGTTSLGGGTTLYAAAQKRVLAQLAARTNEGHAQQLVQSLVALWNAMRDGKVGSVADDVRRFAFDGLPAVLSTYQYRSGQAMVGAVAAAMRDHCGPRDAVEFLVVRAENEARWLARVGQSFWDQFGWQVATWRHEAGRLEDGLSARLLAIVTKELRQYLLLGNERARSIYDARWDGWWREKQREFAEVARAVLAESGDDEPTVVRVASYLHDGLKQYDEGIAVLLERKKQGRLGFDTQELAVDWLSDRKRWKEALPLTSELIVKRPDSLEDRVRHLKTLHGAGEDKAREPALAAAEAHWKEKKLWNEAVIATLAQACLDAALPAQAADRFQEAIDLHVKSAPNRGVGDGVLSTYYARRSSALADLGRTAEAVDAAAGAVLAWGGNQDNRNQAIAALRNVLAQSEDLDAYVAALDAETKKSGLENPTIRRALGNVWFQKKQWAKAAAQLSASLEVEPNDPETQRLLVQTYDKLKQPALAVAQLTRALEVTNHDVGLTRELGERLTKLGDAARAERVHTNLVETMAQESESHEALAKIRESQQRLADAAEQWRQVVRIRAADPTGYLGLARVLVQLKDRAAAREVLEKLITGDWEARFGDVKSEARELERRLGGKSF
jgi:Tfp pilus assembly protein PilF